MASKVMKCYGQYVANDPCYPVCTNPQTGECDYSGIFGGQSGGGPATNYQVTTGDAVAGNTSTRTVIGDLIDPYQVQTGKTIGFSGETSETELWFNQTGDNVITVDGDKYAFEPIFRWNRGCDGLDNSGDGIFPNQNCQQQSGIGGVPGLGVGALRFKNGVMQNV